MEIKKLSFSLLFCLFLPYCTALAQNVDKPMDIPSLELLIAFHKQKYDRLQDRNKSELGHTSISNTVKEIANDYQMVHKELSSRYSIVSSWASTALTALQLAREIKDTYPLLNSFVSYTKHLKNVYVIREYLNTIELLNLECKYLSATIKKIPLLKADAQEIMELLLDLQSRVRNINTYLKNCVFMVQGYIALQNIGYKSSIVDKSKIALKIISEYSK